MADPARSLSVIVYRTDVVQGLTCISDGSTIAPFRLRNLAAVAASLLQLFWDVQIRGARRNRRPNPVRC